MPRKPEDAPPIHPGEILMESFLEPAGISQARFAKAIGVHASYVSDIVAGRRGISAEMALRFEIALDMPAQFWLNAQNAVALYNAKHDQAEIIKRSTVEHLELPQAA